MNEKGKMYMKEAYSLKIKQNCTNNSGLIPENKSNASFKQCF